jgi:hypothetical protein
MVCGFLGTLIGVERAVALGRGWPYAAPLLSALGALALIIGWPAAGLMTLASLGLGLVFGAMLQRQAALATGVMALGVVLWLVGNVCWLAGWPLYQAVPWWAGFLVWTIAGERLELSRLLRLSRGSQGAFVLSLGVYLGGLGLSLWHVTAGTGLTGCGMLGLAVWLLRYDIARRTVRQKGLTRFIAVCLLCGYVWLGASGVLSVLYGGVIAGPLYDAVLHTLFLGFVFTMICGHGPIIFPAILGRPVPYHPGFYAPGVLLQASLLARVSGDLLGWAAGRQWGGLLNAGAMLLFLATLGHGLCWLKPERPAGISRL